MAKERLQKYIANCGYCSRRKAELLIEAGLVRVNGEVVRELGAKIDPQKHTVHIHDEQIVTSTREVIALHKPAGFITSTHDTHERLTVMDLLPRRIAETGVLPAGRLDLETEGLLILTNDGDLQHRITHPRYECEKKYYVELDRSPSDDELARLVRGIYLPDLDRETSPAELYEIDRRSDGTTTLMICVREGMKRQIRRMFEAIGFTVVYLKRLSVGEVNLADLPRGEWRPLTAEEVASLDGGDESAEGTGSIATGETRPSGEVGTLGAGARQRSSREANATPRGGTRRGEREDDRRSGRTARPRAGENSWREESSENRHQRARAARTGQGRQPRDAGFADRGRPSRDDRPQQDRRPPRDGGYSDRGRPSRDDRPQQDRRPQRDGSHGDRGRPSRDDRPQQDGRPHREGESGNRRRPSRNNRPR